MANNYKRIIAFGDIHGCLFLLKKLIKLINPNKDDQLIFLGDYIDRGPDSKETIDYLIELNKSFDCVFLRGNHEDMMMRGVESTKWEMNWAYNGGTDTINSYKKYFNNIDIKTTKIFWENLPESHKIFYNDLRYYYENDSHYFSHAGVNIDRSLNDQIIHDLIWNRGEITKNMGKIIVHGHTPIRRGPKITDYSINVDTGAIYYGKLSAINIMNNEIYNINIHKIKGLKK